MRLDQDTFYNLAVLLLHQPNENNTKIANDVIRIYSTNNQTMMEKDKEIIGLYINILKEIMTTGLFITEGKTDADKQKNLETKALLNKFRTSSVSLKYPSIIEGLNDIIDNKISDKTLSIIVRDLSNNLIHLRSSDHVKKMNKYLFGFDNSIDNVYRNEQIELFKAAADDLSEIITASHLSSGDGHAIESIRLSNVDQVVGAFQSVEDRTVSKVLKFNNVGLLNSTDPIGGFQLGMLVIFAAITNHYKSTMLIQNGRWLLQSNDWSKFGKNVLIPFISLENNADFNSTSLVNLLYHDMNLDDPDIIKKIRGTDPNLKAKAVKHFLEDRNVDFEFQRRDPSVYSHYSLEATINNFIKAGYDIPVSIVDYITLMTRDGLSGTLQEQVQKQVNYLCNFSKSIDHTMISGHQLNAKAIERSSLISNPIMSFDEQCLALAVDVAREIDMLYFLHLVTIAGKRFLTGRKFKDRYNFETSEDNKWFAYQLKPIIGIPSEIKESCVIKSFNKLNEIAVGETTNHTQSQLTF